MAQNPYLRPPAFYVGRGHGKTMLHLMMCLEYLKILDMFEYLNKYRGVAIPKVDLTGVVSEYVSKKKRSQYRFELLSSYERSIMTPWDLLAIHGYDEDI